MSTFGIKSGNRLPVLNAVLARAGVPVDLTTATSVHFVMRSLGATSTKVNAPATVVGSPTLGQVSYVWQVGDTDTPGVYEGSWDIVWADGTPQSFPTEDYQEIIVSASLTQAGALLPVRPTDGYRPRRSDVGGLLANRGIDRTGEQFTETTKPTGAQVDAIISSCASEIDAELAGVEVTDKLGGMATWLIQCYAAATVEVTFFPEQGGSSGTSGIWWTRYQTGLTRFRMLLANEGGGTSGLGSTQGISFALQAASDYADALAAAGLLPDPL